MGWLRRPGLVVALLLAAFAPALAGQASSQLTATASKAKFVISHCDYHTGQGCPAPPVANSCHLKGQAQDRHCTPGVLNPAVTQSTSKQTVCHSGWTATIRPPTSYTEPLKLKELKAYGYGGRSPSGFELDHLISLELAGDAAGYERVDPGGHHHHHIVCQKCGKVIAFEDERLEGAIVALGKRPDFNVASHEVTLRGECADCMKG